MSHMALPQILRPGTPSGSKAIGIALSGGGIRAMAFHCGVLRWLAETARLEQVEHISSVSGGTLLAGLVLAANEWRWPTSKQFLDSIAPRIRLELTTKNIELTGALLLLLPRNWRYILSRANVLSQAIEGSWNIKGVLGNLPPKPIWSINGTTAETGRRFRFKLNRFGDYELGYAEASQFKVSEAMAVSAAVPGAIGPLVINTGEFLWTKRPSWDAAAGTEEPIVLPYSRLHIYDGGVYDNLALEPLIDPGLQRLKNGIDHLICSDASGPLARVSPGPSWSPFRALRLFYIAMDQARALRIRPLANFLQKNPRAGSYAEIGVNPVERIKRFETRNPSVAAELLNREWLSADEVKLAAEHPTGLRTLSNEQFTRLERHGYESIRWNDVLFG
jgi:NTE family protein